jgi:hypothetical protein
LWIDGPVNFSSNPDKHMGLSVGIRVSSEMLLGSGLPNFRPRKSHGLPDSVVMSSLWNASYLECLII